MAKKKREKENKIILIQIVISGLALIASALFWYWADTSKPEVKAEVTPATSTPSTLAFQKLELEAKAFVVYDPQARRVIYGKNEKEALPLASLTKLMTAAAASDLFTPTSTIVISEKALLEEGDMGLNYGERWNFFELLNLMLVASSNDGAAAIASAASSLGKGDFIDLMNRKAKDLNLQTLSFSSPTGLDIENTLATAYGSPEDIAKLMAYLIKTQPQILEATQYSNWKEKSLDNKLHKVKNTNEITDRLPGLLASKTGYTQSSGGNLAVAIDAGLNQPVILVVMGSTKESRFSDTEKLAQASLEYFSQD